MKTDIRPAVVDDLANLHALFAEENRFHAALVPDFVTASDELLSIAELRQFIVDDDYFLGVCDAGCADLCGAILANVHRYGDEPWLRKRRVAYVDELIVTEKYRHRGFGKLLLQSVQAWARNKGLQEIELHVWASNTTAVAFYESFGFDKTRHTLRARVSP